MTDTNNNSNFLPERLISTPDELTQCCQKLQDCKHFGMDTEFVGEKSYHPQLCLVQVATEHELFLIDPETAGPLDAFWNFVTDPKFQVIVHAGREEVRLCRIWGGAPPANLFDLQIAAGLAGLNYPLSHTKLVNQILGIRLPKGQTLTDWRNRPLAPEQIRYAFDDVRFLLPMWKVLSARLANLDREAWAAEEFQGLTSQSALGNDNAMPAAQRWRKLRGAGGLGPRGLAIVRSLYEWREETAARLNRPARTVVRDDLLVEIARRNPGKIRELKMIRGLAKQFVSPMFETVCKAQSLPREQCPAAIEKEQDPPQLGLCVHFLAAFHGNLCRKLHLAENLVASQQEIKRIVRSIFCDDPLPQDSPLTRGWRATAILPELLAVLEGRRSVRIGKIKSPTPLIDEETKGSSKQ